MSKTAKIKSKTHRKPTVALATDQPKVDTKDLTFEIGRSGTPEFSGYISGDYNNEFNGHAGVELFDKMRRTDGTVAAALRAIKYPIMASEWQVEAADKEDERQVEIAEFVRMNLFEQMNFTQFLREALGYLDFGFWYFEKVFRIVQGKIILNKLSARVPTAHECWEMRTTHMPGVTQTLPSRKTGDTVSMQPEIPMSKLVLFVNDQEGDNLSGTPLLRAAYKHFFMKDQLYRIDAVKHERGAGILKVRCPNDEASIAKAAEIGRNFNVNEQSYVVLPGAKPELSQPGWDTELMTAGISDQSASLMESVKHHDRMIVQSILASFLDLGAGATGSLALGNVQSGFFGYALKATADYVTEVINKQIIEELVKLNFGEQEMYPVVRAPRVGQLDQKATAEVLQILNTAGLLTKDPELFVWITRAFGLPERTVEDYEVDETKGAGAGKPDSQDAAGKTIEASERLNKATLARRALTGAEKRVKWAEANDDIDKAEGAVRKTLEGLTEAQKADMLNQASKIIDADDPAAVASLELKGNREAESEIQDMARESMEQGKLMAANEIGVAAPVTSAYAKKALKAAIANYVAERASTITLEARKRLIDILNGDMGKAAGLFELEKIIDQAANDANRSLVGQIVMQPLNEGRWLTFDDAKEQIHAMQRSEILDDATCDLCMSIDGRVLPQADPMTQLDQVHTNCRGLWVAILKTDADLPDPKPLPKSITSHFDLVGGVPTTNEISPMSKPIYTKGSRVARKVKDGQLEV